MALMPVIAPFMWGEGGARLSPEEVARQRKVLEALAGKTDTSPVGHWTQGAARVVDALGGVLKERRLGKQDELNKTTNASLIEKLLGGGGGAFPEAPTVPGMDYASARVGSAHNPDAAAIRQGMIDRGLPEHVADAFVLNFQDESGLNPGINEANPIVPGSRGGFGLAQWTGPRRKALEAFAAERGVDPSDTDAQLDFLMMELQGPEAKAGQSILSAQDTPSAATAILNNFLRPAESHRASREARYLRGGGAPSGGMTNDLVNRMAPEQAQAAIAASAPQPGPDLSGIDPQSMMQTLPQTGGVPVAEGESDILALEAQMAQADPMAFQMPQQQAAEGLPVGGAMPTPQASPQVVPPMAGGPAPAMQAQAGGINPAIIEALSSPTADDRTREIAKLLLGEQLKQQQTQQASRQRMEAAQAAGIDPRYAADDELWKQAAQQQFREPPTSVREFEYGREDPAFYEHMERMKKAGAVSVDARQMGNIPPGFQVDYDEQGRPARMSPIPGSPAALEAEQAARDAAAQQGAQVGTDLGKAETVLDATKSIKEILGSADTPATGTLSRPFAAYSGSPAGKVRSYVGALKSGVALNAMMRLKEASSTGATGFGAMNEKELQLLIDDVGALEPDTTDPEIFAKTIDRIDSRFKRVVEDVKRNVSPERIRELGLEPLIQSMSGGDGEASPQKPLSEMSDEELEAIVNGR